MKYAGLLIVLLMSFAANLLRAEISQVPKKISMQECLSLSLTNSPRLKVSDLEQLRLSFSRRATSGAGLPQVGISGSYDDYLNLPTQMIPNIFSVPPRPSEMIPFQFGTTYNISGALEISQIIYNQSWLNAMKIARKMEEQQQLETERTRIEVVHEVAQSYYMAQVTLRQIENMKSNLAKLEKAERIAASQFEHGLIMRVDLDRIVVQKLNLTTDLERLQLLYEQQLAMQKYYMGLPQEEQVIPDDTITTEILGLVQGNPDEHIDIRMLNKQKQLAGLNIRQDEAGWYPGVTLIGSTGYTNQSNTWYPFGKPTDWFNTSLLGLRLSVPVFSGMQIRNRVSQSKVELDKLRITEEDTRKLIRINSDDAARKLLNSSEAEKRQLENMKLAERVFNITQEQYQKGVVPLTDLLNAETALSDAQTNHTYALIQMKIAELNYLKANGNLLKYFNM